MCWRRFGESVKGFVLQGAHKNLSHSHHPRHARERVWDGEKKQLLRGTAHFSLYTGSVLKTGSMNTSAWLARMKN
jgi:hypothetical protein